ncbi:MAG: uracil-DNA glycosylase [Chitinophagales bacterium]|nr:uracil-DNA glycosylase [Chitinophagales bacterium]
MNTQEINPDIASSWKSVLWDEFQRDSFRQLKDFLKHEKANGKTIYPPAPLIFNAFNSTPFDQLKVVILGQDPYHGDGQAHGLSFSVPQGIKAPPSLVNIFKELQREFGYPIPSHGNLSKWAQQGVLLLNAMLTVEANSPASHQKKGWEQFTNAVIQHISDKKEGIVFILWGRYAQEKISFIDTNKHFILKSAHPSPFSATKFFGCNHFIQTNEILQNQGLAPIDWSI